MSDACCAAAASPAGARCPVSGAAGKRVDWLTVAALLRGVVPPRQELWLCPDPRCQVVYFGAAGTLVEAGDLTVAPGFKEDGSDLVCYCFQHRRAAIARQLAETGTTTVVAAIRERVQAGDCACEVRNPAGHCCLGEVQRVVRELESARRQAMAPAAPDPEQGRARVPVAPLDLEQRGSIFEDNRSMPAGALRAGRGVKRRKPMKSHVGALAVLAVLAFALAALPAQTESKPAAAPAPTRDAALKQFDSFLGNWHCTGTITGPKGQKAAITASTKLTRDPNGHWLSLDYQVPKSEADPLHASAVGHLGHCTLKNYTLILIGSQGNYFIEHATGWEGNTVVFSGEVQSKDAVMKSRDTFAKDGDKRFTHKIELQQGDTWTTVTDESCTRQGASRS